MNIDLELINKLKEQKILPIINSVNFKEDLLKLTSLLDANKKIKIVEITLRESHSLENAIKLKKRFPNLIIGLGSIINKKQYEEVKNYDFSFFVSPGTIYEMIDSKIENYIPGAETISEFNYLDHNEINIVKFFPATLSGGNLKLKSIENVYKNLTFIPTGGINKSNINSYIDLKNVLCVGMSNIPDIIDFFNT